MTLLDNAELLFIAIIIILGLGLIIYVLYNEKKKQIIRQILKN